MKTRIDLASLAKQNGVRRKKVRIRPIEARRATEREYARVLKHLLREAAKIVREQVIPAAAAVKSDLQHDDTKRLDGAMGLLRSAVEFTLLRAAEGMVTRILDLEYSRHTTRFAETVRSSLGIDLKSVIGAADLADEMALVTRRNVALIKDLSEDVAKRVEQAVTSSVMRGGSNRNLVKQLTKEFGFLDTRAETIARDQTATLVSDLNRLRQEQIGITTYIWRDSSDERVRHSHAALDGMECRWDDPTIYRVPGETEWRKRSSIGATEAHPGEEINCRCTAEAVIDL